MIDIHAKGLTDTLIRSAIKLGIKFRIAPKFWMEQLGLPLVPLMSIGKTRETVVMVMPICCDTSTISNLWKLWNGGTNRYFFGATLDMFAALPKAVIFIIVVLMKFMSRWLPKWNPAHDAKPFDLLNPPINIISMNLNVTGISSRYGAARL